MQEVRGSNPLSFTLFRMFVRIKRDYRVTTTPDSRADAHGNEGRGIEPVRR
jgi:hypothetical protein